MIPEIINKAELCELIPHSGSMCLIDAVEFWDDTSIRCRVNTIQHSNHPLENHGTFSVLAAIELGAQSMAVHGGLMARYKHKSIMAGYLAAIKNVEFFTENIDTSQQTLIISAEQLLGDARGQMYDFVISSSEQTLLSGRTTVITWE